MVYAEAGVQTDSLAQKNIVVIRGDVNKIGKKPKVKKALKSINGARPDIKQQWRIWKGIDERNLLRNVNIEEDMLDRLHHVFGENQSEIDKAIETFKSGRVSNVISSIYSKEQMDNRRSAASIGGNAISAVQAGDQWANGANWNMLDYSASGGREASSRIQAAIRRRLAEIDRPAPVISMDEVNASQVGTRGGRWSRVLSGIDTGNIISGGYEVAGRALRQSLNRFVGRERGIESVGSSSVVSAATTVRPSIVQPEVLGGRGPRFGISEGMRSGARRPRTEGYV